MTDDPEAFAQAGETKPVPTSDQQQQPVKQGETAPAKRRSRKRWGEETEQGLKVLEEVQQKKEPPSELPAQQQQGDGASPQAAAAAGAPQQAAPAPKRQRKSRWEAPEETKAIVPGLAMAISLPPSLAHLIDFNPESVELNRQLNLISQQLSSLSNGIIPDEFKDEGNRSPSPEPVYNEQGVRINTRDQRIRQKLLHKRNDIITELIKKNPNYKPPTDYRPERKSRKIRIPQEEYPGYNFIGLIIGPRGNTQKRMERETGARIVIRGKGSVKEGRAGRKDGPPGGKVDPGDNEDLHVLVTADTEDQLERACAMIEKLLSPDDQTMAEHKRMQLRELASLNGTLRDYEALELMRRDEAEPYALPEHLKAKVDEQYARDVAAVHGGNAHEIETEYKSFLKELGGHVPKELLGEDDDELGRARRMRRSPSPHRFGRGGSPPGGGGGYPGGGGPHPDRDRPFHRSAHYQGGEQREPLGPHPPGFHRERFGRRGEDDPANDPCSLYVGYIAPMVEEPELGHLFASFGQVVDCKIIRDRATGMSKGFGFVRMATEPQADACVERLNLYLLAGRRISVRHRTAKPREPPPGHNPDYPPPPRDRHHYDRDRPDGYDDRDRERDTRHMTNHDRRQEEGTVPPGVDEDDYYGSTAHYRIRYFPEVRITRDREEEMDNIDRQLRRDRLLRMGLLHAPAEINFLLEPEEPQAEATTATEQLVVAGADVMAIEPAEQQAAYDTGAQEAAPGMEVEQQPAEQAEHAPQHPSAAYAVSAEDAAMNTAQLPLQATEQVQQVDERPKTKTKPRHSMPRCVLFFYGSLPELHEPFPPGEDPPPQDPSAAGYIMYDAYGNPIYDPAAYGMTQAEYDAYMADAAAQQAAAQAADGTAAAGEGGADVVAAGEGDGEGAPGAGDGDAAPGTAPTGGKKKRVRVRKERPPAGEGQEDRPVQPKVVQIIQLAPEDIERARRRREEEEANRRQEAQKREERLKELEKRRKEEAAAIAAASARAIAIHQAKQASLAADRARSPGRPPMRGRGRSVSRSPGGPGRSRSPFGRGSMSPSRSRSPPFRSRSPPFRGRRGSSFSPPRGGPPRRFPSRSVSPYSRSRSPYGRSRSPGTYGVRRGPPPGRFDSRSPSPGRPWSGPPPGRGPGFIPGGRSPSGSRSPSRSRSKSRSPHPERNGGPPKEDVKKEEAENEEGEIEEGEVAEEAPPPRKSRARVSASPPPPPRSGKRGRSRSPGFRGRSREGSPGGRYGRRRGEDFDDDPRGGRRGRDWEGRRGRSGPPRGPPPPHRGPYRHDEYGYEDDGFGGYEDDQGMYPVQPEAMMQAAMMMAAMMQNSMMDPNMMYGGEEEGEMGAY